MSIPDDSDEWRNIYEHAEFDESEGEDDDVNDLSCPPGNEHTGRWTRAEHELFLEALRKFGREWKKVAAMVKTRTVVQTRTHAQKYFQKFSKFETTSINSLTDDISMAGRRINHKTNSVEKPSKTNKKSSKLSSSINEVKRSSELVTSYSIEESVIPLKKYSETSRIRLSSHPLLPNVPQPSPAACGKRKHAELAAAKMLAGQSSSSSSSSDFEGAQLLSMMKTKSETANDDQDLVINTDLLSPRSNQSFEPSTPWEMDLRALKSKSGRQSLTKISQSSTEIHSSLDNILNLIRSGDIDQIESALRYFDTTTDDTLNSLEIKLPKIMNSEFRIKSSSFEDIGSPPPVSNLNKNLVSDSSTKSNSIIMSQLLNTEVSPGRTLLLEACITDLDDTNEILRLEICGVLLSYGCSLFSLDSSGNNCLHLAALKGFHRLGRMLINNGSLVNSTNKDGETAMHIAARYGHLNFLDMLFQFGANCHVYDTKNQTALAVAGTCAQSSIISRTDIREKMLKAEPRLRTLVLYHDDCLEHATRSSWDWEGPDRLRDIMKNLTDVTQFKEYELVISSNFEKATLKLLQRVHSSEYIAFVDSLSKQIQTNEITNTTVPFTPRVQKSIFNQPTHELKNEAFCDTTFSIGTLQAARRAAGAVAHAVDHVLLGRNRNAFVCVRPPGHHSGYEGLLKNAKSCGFCIFNNIAAGAMHALEEHNCERVAIIDVDVHHGNGTEDIVRRYHNSSRLFFFSVHLYDKPESTDNNDYEFFPGSGKNDDIVHNIINVPLIPQWKLKRSDDSLSSQSGSEENIPQSGREMYREAISKRLVPSLRAFNPSLILISMGFDGAEGDIGNMKTSGGVSEIGMDLHVNDFEWTTNEILRVADLCCNGKVVSVLEGGYGTFNPKKNIVKFERAATRSSASSSEILENTAFQDDDNPINRYTLSSGAVAHVRKLIDPF